MDALTLIKPLAERVLGPLVVIPAGEGIVGSDRPVQAWDGSHYAEYPANGPPRLVRFHLAFWMGQSAVTVQAFRAVCPDVFHADAPIFVLPPTGDVKDRWPMRPFSAVNANEQAPVVGVTWREAATFCERVVQATGLRARLPTEDEWEYAARAGVRTAHGWGDDPRASVGFAWTLRNSEMKVRPVGQLAPNAWGLYDTAGNVWEWCDGVFDGHEGGHDVRRAIRGGAAFNETTAVRLSHRWGLAPDQRNAFLGFRVVVDLPVRSNP